jgi:glycosyltransferase involved in cell wall biosynthesis
MPHLAHTEPEPVRALFSMFEATPVPHFWTRLSAEHDLLVVPTESSRDAWVEGGFPADAVALCPLGVDAELFGSAALPLPLRTEDGRPIDELATRFLNVSELSTRKNIDGLLRVWLRATTAADSAVLVLKLSQYAAGMVDALRRRLDEVGRDAGRRLGDAAPVVVATDLLATEEMPRLYATATHYISMSLGEGWDHPMMEAAASGLELIAPRHSAYMAYLDGQSATLIPATPEPAGAAAGPDLHAFFRRATWWRPDEEAAAAAVRAAIDGHAAPRSPRDRILAEYTWGHSAARLRHLLGELAVTRARRWPWPRPRPRTVR